MSFTMQYLHTANSCILQSEKIEGNFNKDIQGFNHSNDFLRQSKYGLKPEVRGIGI